MDAISCVTVILRPSRNFSEGRTAVPPRWHALEQPRFAESDGGTEPDSVDGRSCRLAEVSEAGADFAGDPYAPLIG
jgi:hypothetical protein